VKHPQIQVNPAYNPFHGKEQTERPASDWRSLYQDYINPNTDSSLPQEHLFKKEGAGFAMPEKFFQLHLRYLVAAFEDGLLVIDQQRAHERILYEHYRKAAQHPSNSQQELFPQTIELSGADMLLLDELNEDLRNLGFDIVPFGKDTVVIQGVPADLSSLNSAEVLHGLLENYKLNNLDVKLDKGENICRALAKNTSIKYGKELQPEEMKLLMEHLFSCENHSFSPDGKVVYTKVDMLDLDKLFRK
jgi:DNA mismatch repair protein MutL